MKIIVDYPQNIEKIKEVFGDRKDVVFTWGSDLYNPSGAKIPDHLLIHEQTHERQQGDNPKEWWDRYLIDPKFRLEQELEAYQKQYHYMADRTNDRKYLKLFLFDLARDLSGPMYNNMISFGEAESGIKKNIIEEKRQKWLGEHKPDSYVAPELTDEGIPDEEIKRKFLSHKSRTGKTPDRIWGVFGEQSGRDGWIEEYIKIIDGGVYTKGAAILNWEETENANYSSLDNGVYLKIYGCSFLFKGAVPEASVHGIEMAKAILFQAVPNLPFFTFLGLGFDFLFRRRRFWSFVDWLGDQVNHRCLRHYDIPEEEYNEFARELLKNFVLSVYRVFGVDLTRPYVDLTRPQYTPNDPNFRSDLNFSHSSHNDGKNRLAYILAKLLIFIVFFLQQDFAYRARVQDAFGEKPRNLRQFLSILMSRETRFGVGYKWRFLLKGIRVIMWMEPKIKELSDAFFELVDFEKVKQDEADKYFSLMYKSYNFQNKSFEERKANWEKINEEKKHKFLFHMPEVEI